MNDEPVLLIVAGPNGSGKTTLTRQLRAGGVDLGFYINPDVIAEGLEGSYAPRVAEAQHIADMQRQDCLSRRASFSFETVMSHPSKIEVLRRARSLGYFVVLYFVGTESPVLNIERVRQRVALGGHDVPHDRIVARYERTMALLPEAIVECDSAVLFDNSLRHLPDKDVILTPICEILVDRSQISNPVRLQMQNVRLLPKWLANVLHQIASTPV